MSICQWITWNWLFKRVVKCKGGYVCWQKILTYIELDFSQHWFGSWHIDLSIFSYLPNKYSSSSIDVYGYASKDVKHKIKCC